MMNRLISAFTTLFMVSSLSAAVTIVNGDMENNTLANSGATTGSVLPVGWIQATGFSGSAGTIGEDRTSVTDDTTAAGHIAWLHLQNINNEAGQNIGTIASNLGMTIRITYDLTRRTNEGTNWNHRVRLYAGDASGYTAVSNTADPDASLSDDFLAEVSGSNEGTPANTFETKVVDLVVPTTYTGSFDRLYLSFKNRAGTTAQLHFDDVSAVVVPEPSSVVLLALGGLGLVTRRRR